MLAHGYIIGVGWSINGCIIGVGWSINGCIIGVGWSINGCMIMHEGQSYAPGAYNTQYIRGKPTLHRVFHYKMATPSLVNGILEIGQVQDISCFSDGNSCNYKYVSLASSDKYYSVHVFYALSLKFRPF